MLGFRGVLIALVSHMLASVPRVQGTLAHLIVRADYREDPPKLAFAVTPNTRGCGRRRMPLRPKLSWVPV